MDISGSVALVTGASGGIGREFVVQLLQRGAAVYATAREPGVIGIPGARALELDITNPEGVAAAVAAAQDVTLVVNSAGVFTQENLVTGDLDRIRLEMETNYFGPLGIVRAFAPVLARNGGGAILNVLSALSWSPFQGANAYAASKAAAWMLTQGVRLELLDQGTLVTGLHMGFTDTAMVANYDVPKNDPADVVRAALDGIQAGELEIVFDDFSAQAKTSLAVGPEIPFTEPASNR